ncbi:hypothetical protein B0H12DRAFT_1321399 [Mycena haematopus]|nr:hypothetical protein B0H12DRAFT_1321399 [Mycena haematopus]
MTTKAPFAACTLTDLPTEILVETISHYQSSFTFLSPLVRDEHVAKHKENCQILRALSQTCFVLRKISLPLLWERFEVPRTNFQPIDPQSELATVIFPYIKLVHISMKLLSTSAREYLFLFVEFLRALPNLTGLQVYRSPRFLWKAGPTEPISLAFANVSLPTVTSLSVPNSLDGILPAFPNLKTLSGFALYPQGKLLLAAKTQLLHLEAIAGLRTDMYEQDARHIISDVARDFPRVRTLSMSDPFPVEHGDVLFASLPAFTQLSELQLLYRDQPTRFLSLDALVAGARDVLRSSCSTKAKIVVVWSYDPTAGPRIIRVERC